MAKALTARSIGAPDFVKELRHVIYTIASNKDTQFTEAIAKDGVERENLVGLLSNRVRINRISIQSDQQLFYEILLYATDEFESADIGLDRFVASIEFNMPIYGFQQTTSQYRMDLGNLNIDYEDLDETKELHVVLVNRSPTSKSAGPDGDVKVEFLCENMA